MYVEANPGGWQSVQLLDRSGRVAFETDGRFVTIGSPYAPATDANATPGEFGALDANTDIDADGVPDVIISSYSGGAHCCWDYALISLSDPPRATFEFSSAVGARFTLENTEAGTVTLIETADTTFAYWRTSYVDSPMPGIAMRLSHGQTTIAADLMRRPAPSPQELASEAARVREAIRAEMEAGAKELSIADYWRTPLELMYSGHEDLAWKFFDDAWPTGVSGRDEFLTDFRELLDQSVYWNRAKAAFDAE